jgi:hypothetical protein
MELQIGGAATPELVWRRSPIKHALRINANRFFCLLPKNMRRDWFKNSPEIESIVWWQSELMAWWNLVSNLIYTASAFEKAERTGRVCCGRYCQSEVRWAQNGNKWVRQRWVKNIMFCQKRSPNYDFYSRSTFLVIMQPDGWVRREE